MVLVREENQTALIFFQSRADGNRRTRQRPISLGATAPREMEVTCVIKLTRADGRFRYILENNRLISNVFLGTVSIWTGFSQRELSSVRQYLNYLPYLSAIVINFLAILMMELKCIALNASGKPH